MQGFALTQEQIIEIISVYSSAAQSILAVAAEPGWNVIGAFPMPTTADIRLDVIGSVSDPTLTMECRVYCVTPGFVGEVSGSRAQLNSTVDVEVFSGHFPLTGGRLYQMQCQVVGNVGDGYFGLVRRAAPAGT
jgi:hypothetical protein